MVRRHYLWACSQIHQGLCLWVCTSAFQQAPAQHFYLNALIRFLVVAYLWCLYCEWSLFVDDVSAVLRWRKLFQVTEAKNQTQSSDIQTPFSVALTKDSISLPSTCMNIFSTYTGFDSSIERKRQLSFVVYLPVDGVQSRECHHLWVNVLTGNVPALFASSLTVYISHSRLREVDF